jgi:superfamily II DNA or RNA helicase
MNCTGPRKLQDHQSRIVKFMLKPENKTVLLFVSTGGGKTLSSLAAANCIIKKYPNKTITVISPASLTSNFTRESKKINIDPNKINIYSYQIFLNKIKKKSINCNNTVLIIDEVQNLNATSSITFKAIYECAKKAYKIILLSATPVKNNPEDIVNQLNLLNILAPNYKKITKSEIDYLSSIPSDSLRRRKLSKLVKCKVSYYKKSDDTAFYPKVVYHLKRFIMDQSYYKEYYKIQEDIRHDIPDVFNNVKNLTAYLNGVRRASNKLHTVSDKIIWILDKIDKDLSQNKKVMIYSSWLSLGVHLIKTVLIQQKVPFSEVTGQLTKDQKDQNVKDYNKDKTKVMLITLSEGISLKGTRTVIIMEPFWNKARIQQVVGRAVRYKSHDHLPETQRKVDVYELLLEKPSERLRGDSDLDSADSLLYKLSHNKENRINKFYDDLKDLSIENDKDCM